VRSGSRNAQRVWIEVDKKKCSAGTLVTVIDQLRVVGGIDVALKTEPPRLRS
jgi:biopolymer transport protein ExbD